MHRCEAKPAIVHVEAKTVRIRTAGGTGTGKLRVMRELDRAAALRALADWTSLTGDSTGPWACGPDLSAAEADRLLATGAATAGARAAYDRVREGIEATVGARIQTRAQSARRVRRFSDVDGDAIDTARVMAGDASCWERRERTAKRRTFRLGINLAVPAVTEPDTFERMAAALCAVADALARRGYGVELTPLSFVEDCGEHRLLVLDAVKRAEATLDVEAVLSLGQPAALRRLGFALSDWTGLEFSGCRGFARHPGASVLAAVGLDYCFSTTWAAESPDKLREHADGLLLALFGDALGDAADAEVET